MTIMLSVIIFSLILGCPSVTNNIGSTDSKATAVTFKSAVQSGGTDGVTDSTGLTLTFDADPTTLAASDITVTGATKGALSGSGISRNIAISGITVDNGETVSVTIASPNGYTISGLPQAAAVYRKSYNLRDIGPAGGLIFYDKGSYSDGWRYLEAAPASTEWTGKKWGKYGTAVGGTKKAIGTGKNNTTLILAVLNAVPTDSDRAAQLCDELEYSGFSDWFLPSLDELNSMSKNLKAFGVGGFANNFYWSSSEYEFDGSIFAWYQNFTVDIQICNSKDSNVRVRAIRAF